MGSELFMQWVQILDQKRVAMAMDLVIRSVVGTRPVG